MYQIMKTGSSAYMGCQDGRGEYPTGGTMGKAFCLFDTLGLVRITDFYLITLQRIQGYLQNSNIKNLQNSSKKIITEFFKKNHHRILCREFHTKVFTRSFHRIFTKFF